ncbi:MAG: ATP-dependent helicase [Butyrivibrio sp.]|nr:ATP-dependent helicase [Butyrivibrio sp.]
MEFNDSQLKAVKHGERPMLVIAGPGSGKTAVLTARIQNLIDEYRAEPSRILVITFTKAAALQMEERFVRLIGRRCGVTFGTFHAVFFKILRATYNYSVENIIKDDKREFIIRQAAERSKAEPEDMNEFIRDISGEISRVKTEGTDIEAYYSKSCPEEEFRQIYKYYETRLRQSGLLDFDDMLLLCRRLLCERRDVLEAWQRRYKYILIDEFQDINRIQYEVVKMLALPENNLFIVGDDDQSIYGFRGSRPDIMLNFERDFPNARRVVLDTNYRSAGNIVEAAGRVIAHNKARFAKNIASANEAGAKVEIAEFVTEAEQYERIADMIREAVKNGASYADYAVIFRINAAAAPLVRKLMEKNIPFLLRDGVPNIFEHWIAADIRTYIAVASGSRRRSDFLRIMNKPKRYIGRDYLTSEEISLDELEKLYEDKPWMTERLDKLGDDLNAMAKMPPYAMINYLRRGVGYDGYLAQYAKEHGLEAKELYDVIDELMESAKPFKSFELWFEYIESYTRELKEGYDRARASDEAVTLTTMHGSKGLEYDCVFIPDANEGSTPYKKAVLEPDIEEERRMFYVAMTRARRSLNIFYSLKRHNREQEPSRFVREIMGERD